MSPAYLFNRFEYEQAAALFTLEGYAGYRPTVKENADGKDLQTIDDRKRFLHIALKYPHPQYARELLARAHFEACTVARRLGVPALYMPDVENATLRVLDYPAGAGTVPHTDFNLFTVVCYRSHADGLRRDAVYDLDDYSPGLHIGELGEMCELGPATRHSVPPTEYTQRSIVYFASPRMDAPLPNGPVTFPKIKGFEKKTVQTCGEWQIERVNRSRVYK